MGELKIFWNVERQQINRMKLLNEINRARCGGSSRGGSSSMVGGGYTDQIKDSMENLNGAPTVSITDIEIIISPVKFLPKLTK